MKVLEFFGLKAENPENFTKEQKEEFGIFAAVVCICNLIFFGLGFWLPFTLADGEEIKFWSIVIVAMLTLWLVIAGLRRLIDRIQSGYSKWMVIASLPAQSIPLLLPTASTLGFGMLFANFGVPDLGYRLMKGVGGYLMIAYFLVCFLPTALALIATHQKDNTL